MRFPIALPVVLLLSVAPLAAQGGDTARIPGFTPAASAAQRALEARFLSVPSSASAARTVRELSREPHLAGTPGSRRVAEWLAAELRALGFETDLERYDVYLPHPVRVEVEILAPERRAMIARERLPRGSPWQDSPTLWWWNAYSGDGEVRGPVVYANHGTSEDYDELERLGVEVRGRIVLVRYGRTYRGVKAAEAEARGAAGVLLYSDPAADGFAAGDTLPFGPYRPAGAVQRGTVSYFWHHTGDPLTPGRPSLPGVPRLSPSDSPLLPRIPVVPLPYGEAERIFLTLGGPEGPERFRGGLPLPYRLGAGETVVRLRVEQEYAERPVWNVIGRLRGSSPQEVVIGSHHDAWVFGGVDALSGTSAVLEIARGLSRLRESGWRPRRGVTLAFWDAEEFGVIGSTEWVEQHERRLRENAVAYFNVDVYLAGVLDVSGSPSLRGLVAGAAEAVRDPVTGRTLGEEWRARQRRGPDAPLLGEIGAGSDWTAFLHFAGIPSLQWTMNGRGTYAVYHSALDDHAYAARWGDSAFVHAPAMAGVMGVAALRLMEAGALPFDLAHYADRIEHNLGLLSGTPAGQRLLQPEQFGRLQAALARLRAAGERWTREQELALASGDTRSLRLLDERLARVEQDLLDIDGLPGRPWFRHQVHATGRDTGYDALPLPALQEALIAGDEAALARAVDRLEAALERAARGP